MLDND